MREIGAEILGWVRGWLAQESWTVNQWLQVLVVFGSVRLVVTSTVVSPVLFWLGSTSPLINEVSNIPSGIDWEYEALLCSAWTRGDKLLGFSILNEIPGTHLLAVCNNEKRSDRIHWSSIQPGENRLFER
jgi:hypothetical protein